MGRIRILKLHIAVIATLICLAAQAYNFNAGSPKREARAVWLTTIGGLDWPHTYSTSPESEKLQKQELCETLDKLKAANVNIVLLQTRIRATTIYPSALEPWDGCLSGRPGVSPGYDALEYAIDECHKRGMEIHAWVVAIPIGRWNGAGCKRLRKRYPAMVCRIGNEGYLNPESPQTADYIARICKEITQNYDIDGIHLDYIRYPETWRKRIDKESGRACITNIVRETYKTVKAEKPWVKVSCSPIGKFSDLARYSSNGWNAYDRVCQDAQGWLKEGVMDAVFPMMYFRGNQFYPFAIDWQEHSHGRIVSVGLGLYFLSQGEDEWSGDIIKRQLNVLRQMGIGHAYFRSKFFTNDVKGIYSFVRDKIDTSPALVPPMTWQSTACPPAPVSLKVRRYAEYDELEWNGAENGHCGSYLTYNVYISGEYPVDTENPENLAIANHRGVKAIVPHKLHEPLRNYAVTAMDRYGNESRPTTSERIQAETERKPWLRVEGGNLHTPPLQNVLDAEFLIVESLQGSIIATRPYRSAVSVSAIPDGLYILKTLNKKGIVHTLGWFQINRQGALP